jgi:uncharacterized protein
VSTVVPMPFGRKQVDTVVLELLEESGANAERAAVLLGDLLTDYPEHRDLAGELKDREHDGDRITHDVIHRLSGNGGLRPPFDPADGHALATALDDIVDYAEQTADWLGLHAVEAPMEQAVQLGAVLVGATRQVAGALRALRANEPLRDFLVEINRLENDGDRLHREAVAALFVTGIDPMVVLRWKDIFESLEAAIDACETVAHILEGIQLKRRS